MLRLKWPELAEAEERAFDDLLEQTPSGGVIDYDLPQPKWIFLHHLVRHGYVLHGSNEGGVDEFRTRPTYDAHGQPIDAVFATDDAVWPIYFAVVRREGLEHGYINWCVHVRNESRYLFSIGRDPDSSETWTSGTIYVLPDETFTATPASREFTSPVPVRPRALLRVEPDDFPFRRRTLQHGAGDSPRTVVRRATLTRHGRLR
jgi:hypothetical protein